MPELKTRIQLKYDTLANWNASTFALKAGEVAIATTGETVSENLKGTNKPVLMKVGPGVFKDLPWLSALAADVYDWAKQTPEQFATYVKGLIEVTDIDAYSKKQVDDLLAANSIADKKYADDAINDAQNGILATAEAYTDAAIAGLPKATADKFGLVKVDNVTIQAAEDGVISVKAISTDLLTQGNNELILNGGSAVINE